MWSSLSWAESATSRMTQALEKTGDAISKAATQAGRNARSSNSSNNQNDTDQQQQSKPKGRYDTTTAANSTTAPSNTPMPSLAAAFTSAVSQTKHTVEHKIKEQQAKLQQQISNAKLQYYQQQNRKLDLPALRDAQVVYITNRIITMGHPGSES